METLVGIDAGTSSVKALVVRARDGKVISSGTRGCRYARRTGEVAEQDAAETIRSALAAAREAMDKAREKGQIEVLGVGFSGQMHGGVIYDRRGKAMTPIVTWEDQRATEEVLGAVRSRAGEALSRSGCGFATGYIGATLASMDRGERERAGHFLTTTDVVRRGFSDETGYTTDASNASSTGLYDIAGDGWNEEVFEAVGISAGLAPEIAGTCCVVGKVSREAARETGIAEGTPVAVGGGDQPMSMIGTGVVEACDGALVNLGTGSQVARKMEEARTEEGLITFAFPGGGYSVFGAGLAGGRAFSWWRELVGAGFEDLLALAGEANAGSDRVRFTPLLSGTRVRPELRGSFQGLSLACGAAQMTRAVLEGIVAELYAHYRKIAREGDGWVTGAGGLMRAAVVQSITAGSFGLPVRVRTGIADAALGAAAAAGVASGVYGNVVEAARALVSDKGVREVKPELGEAYGELREGHPVLDQV